VAEQEAPRQAAAVVPPDRLAEACRAAVPAARVVRELRRVVPRDPWTARRARARGEKMQAARAATREQGQVKVERAELAEARLAAARPMRAEPTRAEPT
jgi:hypothetical protein